MANVDQFLSIKNAKHQRSEDLSATLRFGEAADHGLLAKVRFDFEPRLTAVSLSIQTPGVLGYYPFQSLFRNGLEESHTVFWDVFAQLDVR